MSAPERNANKRVSVIRKKSCDNKRQELSNVLKDFGAELQESAISIAASASCLHLHRDAVTEAQNRTNTDALVAESVARAEAALIRTLEEEHDRSLQAERERHAKDISELQKQFAEEAGDKIAAGIESMEKRILELTSTITARILGAVLSNDIRERSLEQLSSLVRETLTDNDAIRIHICGNLPLYDALKTKLPHYAQRFDFVENPHFDLSVTINDSIFEIRLTEWSSMLAEALP